MRISRGGFDFRNHTIVEVHTDDGITGLGEGRECPFSQSNIGRTDGEPCTWAGPIQY